MKRVCVCCQKKFPLNDEYFQVVPYFKNKYSFCCLTCDKESKKIKVTKKEEKFQKEKLEVKLQHRDLIDLIQILGYYKGMLESTVDPQIPMHVIDRMLEKIRREIENHKK